MERIRVHAVEAVAVKRTDGKEGMTKVGRLATMLPMLLPAAAILVAVLILRPMLREGLFVDPA